jgi:hypothetical protein
MSVTEETATRSTGAKAPSIAVQVPSLALVSATKRYRAPDRGGIASCAIDFYDEAVPCAQGPGALGLFDEDAVSIKGLLGLGATYLFREMPWSA